MTDTSLLYLLAGLLLAVLAFQIALFLRRPDAALESLRARLEEALRNEQRDGRLELRQQLDGLAATPVLAGLPATVCVLLGATVYDAGSNSTQWVRFVQSGSIDRDLILISGIEERVTPLRGGGAVDLDDPDLDERERVIAALEQAGWVQAKAARLLNMTPRQIAYRIQTLNIKVRQI